MTTRKTYAEPIDKSADFNAECILHASVKSDGNFVEIEFRDYAGFNFEEITVISSNGSTTTFDSPSGVFFKVYGKNGVEGGHLTRAFGWMYRLMQRAERKHQEWKKSRGLPAWE